MRFISEGCYELIGYEPYHLIDNKKINYTDLINPEDKEKVKNEILNSIKKRTSFHVTYRITTANNEEKWIWHISKTDPTNSRRISANLALSEKEGPKKILQL
jgi:hypothetical protein